MSSSQHSAAGKRKRGREPNSASSKYVPPKNVLELENRKEDVVTGTTITDESIIEYVKSLKAKLISNSTAEPSMVQIVVCNSEAEYFENDSDIIARLKSSFQVTDVSLSPRHPVSIDRLLTISGEKAPIARLAVSIAFIINSKLNKICSRKFVYTLRSTNYHLRLGSKSNQMGSDEKLKSVRLTGDLQQLLVDTLKWLEKPVVANDFSIDIYGSHDTNLPARGDGESSDNNHHKALTYIYSQ